MKNLFARFIALLLAFTLTQDAAFGQLRVQGLAFRKTALFEHEIPSSALFRQQALQTPLVNALHSAAPTEEIGEFRAAAHQVAPKFPTALTEESRVLYQSLAGLNMRVDFQKAYDLVILFLQERPIQAPSQASVLLGYLNIATRRMQVRGLITAEERVALYEKVIL